MGESRPPSPVDLESGDSMGRRVFAGAAWSSVGRFGNQLIQFVAGVVLARFFLTPADFGLVVIVLTLTNFAAFFFEAGLTAALIQLEDLNDDDLSTVFWLNALGGLVFAGLMSLCGPLLAAFFGDPRLVSLTPVVALSFTVHIGVCHQALLERGMQFRRLAGVELMATAIGFTATIALAAAGAGVFALAIGPIISNMVASAGFWRAARWRPGLVIRKASIRRIWRFSAGAIGFNVVNYWGVNLDSTLIGRVSGASALGLYNRAFNFMLLPVTQVGVVLGRVMFPALSAMRDDRERAALAYRRALRVAAATSLPALAGIAVVAPALVATVWGDNWTGMVPLLMILCLAGLPQSMSVSTSWVYQSQGRTDLMFKMSLLTSGFSVAAVSTGIQWGTTGVAWAVVARSWLLFVPEMHVACRLLGLRGWDVIMDNIRAYLLTATMASIVWALPHVLGVDRSAAGTLGAQVALGVMVYGAGSALWQRHILTELKDVRAGGSVPT